MQFGHKVNPTTGKSNLILSCEVLKGNSADSTLYKHTLDKVIGDYGVVPRDSDNSRHSQNKGIPNIVFNKVVGSLKNIACSKNMETPAEKVAQRHRGCYIQPQTGLQPVCMQL